MPRNSGWLHSRCIFVLLVVGSLAACVSLGTERAAAGFDVGDCRAQQTDPNPVFDESQEAVATLQVRGSDLAIVINPFRYNFSNETVRWLFLRQCALAQRYGLKAAAMPIQRADHEWADCEAVKLMGSNSKSGRFELRAIQSDLEAADDRFWQVNLGGRRFIDLGRCASSKAS